MAIMTRKTLVSKGALSPARPPYRLSKKWVEASSPLNREVINPLRTRYQTRVTIGPVPTDVAVLARHAALELGFLP